MSVRREALAVSEAYFGHSGSFSKSEETVRFTPPSMPTRTTTSSLRGAGGAVLLLPLSDDGSKTAVLLMNAGTASESMTVEFKDVPGLAHQVHRP